MPRLAGTRPIIRLTASGEVTVGRSAEAQIQLNYAFISRRHARLIVEAGRAYVVPLCRDNLVTVNGEPVARGARVELRFGDAVSFVKEEADFAYRVERRAPSDDEAPRPADDEDDDETSWPSSAAARGPAPAPAAPPPRPPPRRPSTSRAGRRRRRPPGPTSSSRRSALAADLPPRP